VADVAIIVEWLGRYTPVDERVVMANRHSLAVSIANAINTDEFEPEPHDVGSDRG
jgi:hypothetical protein